VANILNAYASTSHTIADSFASHMISAAQNCPEDTLEARHIGMILNALARASLKPPDELALHFGRSLSFLDVSVVGGQEVSLMANACAKLRLMEGHGGRKLLETVLKFAEQVDDTRYVIFMCSRYRVFATACSMRACIHAHTYTTRTCKKYANSYAA
jgi:hypothetical protein